MHLHIPCKITYSTQDVGATVVSVGKWMDKEDVACIYNAILLCNTKEWNLALCDNMVAK